MKNQIAMLMLLILVACGGGSNSPEVGPEQPQGIPFAHNGVVDMKTEPINIIGPATVRVRSTGHRRYTTAAGQIGLASLRCWVSILNLTKNQLVPSAQDYLPNQIDGLAAGKSAQFDENIDLTVTVPDGQTFEFTGFARSFTNFNSVGTAYLETTDYTFTVQ